MNCYFILDFTKSLKCFKKKLIKYIIIEKERSLETIMLLNRHIFNKDLNNYEFN